MQARRWFELSPERVALGFLLAVVLVVEVHVAYATSISYDEFGYIGAAFCTVSRAHTDVEGIALCPLVSAPVGLALHAGGVREQRSAMDVDLATREPLHWWTYGEHLLVDDNRDFKIPFAQPGLDSVTTLARLVMITFPLLGLLLAYGWSRERFGAGGALVSTVLLATLPDFLANGPIVKADLPLGVAALAAGYACDRLATRGGTRALVVAGLAVGAMFAAKTSALFELAGFAVAFVALVVRPIDPEPARLVHPFGVGARRRRTMTALGAAVAIAALALAFLWVVFLGENPLHEYWVGTVRFQASMAGLRQRTLELSGFTGVWVWLYWPYVALLKWPLATLALIALGVVLLLRGDCRGPLGQELILLAPPVCFLAATVAVAPPFGTRYLLAVAPAMLVSTGRVATWAGRSVRRWALVGALLVLSIGGAVRDHPFYAGATNLLAGPPELAWRRLNNANVDWGTGLKALARWQRERGVEEIVVVPFTSDPARLVQDQTGRWFFAYSVSPRMAHLDEYGVRGVLGGPNAIMAPERGKVYAVSAEVENCLLEFEREVARLQWAPNERPEVVLGRTELPSEVVGGGFLIFDRR